MLLWPRLYVQDMVAFAVAELVLLVVAVGHRG